MEPTPSRGKAKSKVAAKKTGATEEGVVATAARPDWFWRFVILLVLLFVMVGGAWLAYQVVVQRNAQPYSNAKMEEVLACSGSLSTHTGVQLNTATAAGQPGAASASADMALSTYVELHVFKRLPPDKLLDGMKFFADCMAKQRKLPNGLLEPGRKASNLVWGEYSRMDKAPALPAELATKAVDAARLYTGTSDEGLSPKERTAKAERTALMYFVATEVHIRGKDDESKKQAMVTAKKGLEAANLAIKLYRENEETPDFIAWRAEQKIQESLADRWLEAVAQVQALETNSQNVAMLEEALGMMSCDYIRTYSIGTSMPLTRINFDSPRIKQCMPSSAAAGALPAGPLK